MRWLGTLRKASKPSAPGTTPAQDLTVATLTARADLILEELDDVVKQMSTMLRERAANNGTAD
jgi:hypothetical protein